MTQEKTVSTEVANEDKIAAPGHFREINPVVTGQMDEAMKIKELETEILADGSPDAKTIVADINDFVVTDRPAVGGIKIDYRGSELPRFNKALTRIFPDTNIEIWQVRHPDLKDEMRGMDYLVGKRVLLEKVLERT